MKESVHLWSEAPAAAFGVELAASLHGSTQAAPRYAVVDRLVVEAHADRAGAGRVAARAAAAYLRDVVASQGEARVIFACAPSQDEFLAALVDPAVSGVTVPWTRITAFHMDDYFGIAGDDPQSFRHYLQTHFLKHVKLKRFYPLMSDHPVPREVCADYGAQIARKPIDLICLGVGENGHIAFNDPPVADFDDPVLAKAVDLDIACRQQQVNDGCFPALASVPAKALTLTIPVFRQARRLSIHVFGSRKANAVRAMLREAITPACPASILRTHPNATLFVDRAAAALC